MAPKRKQPRGETRTDSSSSAPTKRIKENPKSTLNATPKTSLKRKQPADDTGTDSVSAAESKKLKANPERSPTDTPQASSTRRKKSSPSISSSKSALVPRGGRKKATVGQKDDSLLRMLCDDSKSGTVKELHFRKIPHSMIDWHNSKHISDINNWRNQIYGRAGLKAKEVTMWHEEEELWFELYFQLSIAESRTRGFLLPKTSAVLVAFNDTFVGRVLTDKDGNEIEARSERKLNAFASKFNRMCPKLRVRLLQCVFGKSGDVFVPEITPVMLQRYKEMKVEMAGKGITEESAYSDNLGDWQYFLSHLPTIKDVKIHATAEKVAAATAQANEDNAAAALMSLANQSLRVPVPVSSNVSATSNSRFDSDRENITPKIWQTPLDASSQPSASPYTPFKRAQVFGDHTEIMDEDDSFSMFQGHTDTLVASDGKDKFASVHYFETPDTSTPTEDFHQHHIDSIPQNGS